MQGGGINLRIIFTLIRLFNGVFEKICKSEKHYDMLFAKIDFKCNFDNNKKIFDIKLQFFKMSKQ